MSNNNKFPPNDDVVVRVPITFGTNSLESTHNDNKKQRKCGLCNQIGHNKRSCPQKVDGGKFFHHIIDINDIIIHYVSVLTLIAIFFLQDIVLLIMFNESTMQLSIHQLQPKLLTLQQSDEIWSSTGLRILH